MNAMKPPIMEVAAISPDRKIKTQMRNDRVFMNQAAAFAMELIKTGQLHPDGVDANGFTLFRLADPVELVKRSVTIAQLAVTAFEEKGWLLLSPPITELLEDETSTGFLNHNREEH